MVSQKRGSCRRSETEVTFRMCPLAYSILGMTRAISIGDSERAGKPAATAAPGQPMGAVRLTLRGLLASSPSAVRHRNRTLMTGVTLVELLVVVAMLVAISAIAVPMYQDYIDDVRLNNVRKDFALIELHIERFRTENGGSLPDSLNETAATTLSDPWGNPYRFLNIEDAAGPGLGKVRKDKNLVPLNTDFDLYSMGRDGKSKSPLTAKASHDDVVRANNGAYVGLASEY